MTAAWRAPVLVTGGGGFIGSHLVDRLLDDGASVTVLDDFSTGRRENLAHRSNDPRLRIVEGTVLDPDLVEVEVAAHPLVFHLAAAVGVRYIVDDPLKSIRTNVRGTEHVLASAHRRGARVVFASTSEVYGRSQAVPFREDSERVLGPTWVDRWSYSTAKALDEHIAFAYAKRGAAVSVIRYFNSYGPRLDRSGYGSVIARFASQAMRGETLTVHGDGTQTRCFTYVSDTVRGTMLAGSVDAALGSVFNIGGDHEVSILELAQRIKEMLGSRSRIEFTPYESYYPIGFQDTQRRVPDVSRAHDVLGFRAEVDFETGLEKTLHWAREHFA